MRSSPAVASKLSTHKGATINKTTKEAAPVQPKATSKTNTMNNITPTAHGARARKPLAAEQRRRFWNSVGEAIELVRAGRVS